MKKYAFLSLFLCLFQFGNSQNVNTSLASDINTVFAPLEKNRIPNGILLDYGFDLIEVAQFDGVLRSNNYLNLERYNQIYNAMVSSATQANIQGIVSPQQELSEWKTIQKQQNDLAKFNNKASVVVSGLLFNYSKINANALSNNIISVVNGTYDDKYINGVWQNPYDNKLTFAVTSPVFILNRSNVEVTLPTTLWHTNTNLTVVDIDFGNNTGYKSLTNGAIATTNYTAIGTYTWTYRVRISKGQYKYCRQKVKVEQVDDTIQARNPVCGALPQIEPIIASKSFQGIFGTATLQIVRGGACNEIRNPLIVAEGLDTGLMAQGGSIGDSDINSFFQSIDQSLSANLQDLITNNTAVDYDIIYVNWDNGTDFIQRNAYVLEAVIDWVNDNKVGNAQNVVLGQSMGGLIARYALRDMENNNQNHDTRLYVSHDAPHQGAHIPVGILHMGRDVVNQFIQTPLGGFTIPINGTGSFGLATIDDLLDAPAINQMLINSVDTNGNRTNAAHTTWQADLQAMGYPQQTRNIALSNASHCASSQGLSSNQEFVTVTGKGGTSVLTSIIELLVINIDPLIGIALNDTAATLLGFLPGNSNLDVEFRANAFSSSGIARIYKGRLTYEKRFLWLIPITRTIFDNSEFSQSTDKFIDNYPGGISPNGLAIANSDGDDNLFVNYEYNLNINLLFDFIPVTSALDVGSGSAILNDSDYFRKYTSANPPTGNLAIPFVNFTTSLNQNNNLNAEHISYNRRNGDWLAEELDADTNIDIFDCKFICGDSQIIGPSVLCSSATYSVSVPAGTTVNWSISNTSAASITSQSGGNVTISATIGYRGDIILTSNISSDCGNVPLTKPIRVGNPDSPSSISGPSTVNTGAIVNYVAGSSNGATSYEWRLPYPFTIRTPLDYMSQDWQLEGPGNTGNARAVTGYTKKSGYVQVMGKNACGTGGAKLLYVQHATSGGGGGGTPRIDPNDDVVEVTLYPNPTNGKITVALTNLEDYSGEPPTLIYGIQVLDQNFYERKFYNFNDQLRSKELNVSYLNTGLNYIIVYTDTGTFTKKLIVY